MVCRASFFFFFLNEETGQMEDTKRGSPKKKPKKTPKKPNYVQYMNTIRELCT